jgi:hypothetical protein
MFPLVLRRVFLIAILSLLGTLSPTLLHGRPVAGTTAAAVAQLLRNPGFEEGLAHWSTSGTVEHVSSPTRNGSGAVRLNGGGATITQSSIAIPGDATSVIPRFAYRAATATTSSLRMTIHDAASGAELYTSSYVSVWPEEANTWLYYDEGLRANDIARAARGKTVTVRMTAPNVAMFVDDITLETDGTVAPEPPPPGESWIYLPLVTRGTVQPEPGDTYRRVDALPFDGAITDIEFQDSLGFMTGSDFTEGRLWAWTGSEWFLVPGSTSLRDLNAVTILPSGEAWAAGGNCTIIHRIGTTWRLDAVPESCAVELAGVWANSATDAWAISSFGDVLRWNGGGWQAAGELSAEAGIVTHDLAFFSAEHGFVVGQASATDARIWTYQQGAWRAQTYPDLRSFSSIALRGADGWIVGERGVTMRWLNGQWTQQPSNVTTDFQDVHIAPDGLVFATAEGSLLDASDKVYQRVGDRWIELPAPPAETLLQPGPIATGPDRSLWVGAIDSLLRYRE